MKRIAVALFNTIGFVLIIAVLTGVGAVAYATATFNQNSPCPESPEARRLSCEDEPTFIGMGTHEDYIPSNPVCGCTIDGVRVHFSPGEE